MSRIQKTMLFILISIFGLISCAQPSNDVLGTGNVMLSPVEEKGIVIEDAGGISKYEYTAEPLFSLTDGTQLFGRTDGWQPLEADSDSSVIIGPFTQGRWKFKVQARNNSGDLLWNGSGEGYVGASTLAVIPIEMHRMPGVGSLEFTIDIPSTTSNLPAPEVIIDHSDKPTHIDWSRLTKNEGTTTFVGKVDGLTPGWHSVAIRYIQGKMEAGDAVAVEILAGSTATIKGAFEVGKYEKPHFAIDHPYAVRVSIEDAKGNVLDKTDNMKCGTTHEYICKITSGRKDATVDWYVNGEKKGTGTKFVFTPQFNGIYSITAMTRYYKESKLGHGWMIEESGSNSVTVMVRPDMATIKWIMDKGNETIQHLPYSTEIEVGEPKTEDKLFSYWNVTGGVNKKIYAGEKLTLDKAEYTFTAVWGAKPALRLNLSSAMFIDKASGCVLEVPELGLPAFITSGASAWPVSKLVARWFLDGKEVFWITDRGNGIYQIPSASEIGIAPGEYPLKVVLECGDKSPSWQGLVEWK